MIAEKADKICELYQRIAAADARLPGTAHREWDEADRLLEDLVHASNVIVSSICTGAFCTPQEWDQRIDCEIKLPDGSFVGEMISLSKISETRLQETAERLRRLVAGEAVSLVDALRGPTAIIQAKPHGKSE